MNKVTKLNGASFFFRVGDETESALEELLTLGRCNDEDVRMEER